MPGGSRFFRLTGGPPTWLLIGMLGVASIVGCDGGPRSPSNSQPRARLSVLATTGMIADAVREVGGDDVEVDALMGPGVDPHLYQPTARDRSRLRQAQVVFYNGLHLEGKMVEFFESLSKSRTVVAVTSEIPPSRLLAWSESGGLHDPHVWFDVELWRHVVKAIEVVLQRQLPDRAAAIGERAARYDAQLSELDAYCRRRVDELPPEQRLLVTSHDAFHYFGRAYGFEVLGLQGISTESEAGLKAIIDAVDAIRARRLKAIFPETSVPRAAIERVAKDSGAGLGPELYSDALGAPDSPAGTYIGMFRANMDHIVDGLLGKASSSK